MATTQDGIEQVDPSEVDALIDEGAFLLDVREPSEWQAGHSPLATHVPMGDIATGHAGVLPRDATIVVTCRSGNRSQRVAQFLKQEGYNAVNAAGGMNAWFSSGREVVTDDGSPGVIA